MKKVTFIKNTFIIILVVTIYVSIHLSPISTARVALISYGSFSGKFVEVEGKSEKNNSKEYYLIVGNEKRAFIELEKSKLGLWKVDKGSIKDLR
jgi:hypothetical protein